MKKIYAPWRHTYVTKKNKAPTSTQLHTNDCVFCHKFSDGDDEKHLIIKRFDRSAVVMNYYPYNAGHIMVLPLEHKPSLEYLDKRTRAEMMEAVTHCVTVLQKTMNCEGHNIGINLGIAGGGGIPSHLHIHVLPRWKGDTSFLATTAETNIICSDFKETYKDLLAAFKDIEL
ncbi:HIT domain-containing protein [Candidatus Dependentiae bacterium]|nr:HIT domain-containing protein [Candidatus Dependentiae bacterium]